ncbi:MAG: nicotinate-nucleotide adenylyltransferase [Armatimonadota bacterium]|nr:nicotinate-nucleotide adenylyltransferase [bacterium]
MTSRPADMQTRGRADQPTRLGIMGGTFDPVHVGHLILAEQARERFGLDKVLFITAADPPHKTGNEITPVACRHEMACLAVENNERFECSTIEIERGGPSYTIDTLRQLREIYSDGVELYLLAGADEAATFMTWRDPYGIQEMARVVVANRCGQDVADVLRLLPEDFARNVELLQMPGVDISSTDLRERVRSGRSIKYFVPESVERYILSKGLYRG